MQKFADLSVAGHVVDKLAARPTIVMHRWLPLLSGYLMQTTGTAMASTFAVCAPP
jgi:hypothetical protein